MQSSQAITAVQDFGARDRAWVERAIKRIEADFARSADTHLLHAPMPRLPTIDLYLKDKSTHPTGSLKHRLARSLFLYALCNGWLGSDTPIVEASSGSTAVSEAYFARMLGPSIHRRDAPLHLGGEDRPDRLLRRRAPFRRHAPRRCAPTAPSWRARSAAISWTSSPMPNGPPTGAATTTSPSPSSPRCRTNRRQFRPGSWSGSGTGGTSATLARYVRYRRPADPHRAGRPRGVGLPPPCHATGR